MTPQGCVWAEFVFCLVAAWPEGGSLGGNVLENPSPSLHHLLTLSLQAFRVWFPLQGPSSPDTWSVLGTKSLLSYIEEARVCVLGTLPGLTIL